MTDFEKKRQFKAIIRISNNLAAIFWVFIGWWLLLAIGTLGLGTIATIFN